MIITKTTTVRDVMIDWRSKRNLQTCETPSEAALNDEWERSGRSRTPGMPRVVAVALGYKL